MKKSALKLFTLSGLIFLAGVCLGSAAVCLVPEEISSTLTLPVIQSGEYLRDRSEVLLSFAASAVKPVIIMWIFGFTRLSAYANIAALGYRGGIFGSIIGSLCRTLGLYEGFSLSVIGILPQNLMYILVLLAMAVLSYEFSVYKTFTKKAIYFCILAVCIAVCFLCGFFDAYITSAFLTKGVNYAVQG